MMVVGKSPINSASLDKNIQYSHSPLELSAQFSIYRMSEAEILCGLDRS